MDKERYFINGHYQELEYDVEIKKNDKFERKFMSAAKDSFSQIEELFVENAKGFLTYEKLVKLLDKAPTATVVKKIEQLAKTNKVQLITSAEAAKLRNLADAKKRQENAQKSDQDIDEDLDLSGESDLLEWSRSDSPVRMYLREMGQIALLTKDEEVEISKRIELGEDIIIDAFCSVPFLIDFILDYKEPLINRERRVKELFKSFEDESENEENEDSEDDIDEEDEENEENGTSAPVVVLAVVGKTAVGSDRSEGAKAAAA